MITITRETLLSLVNVTPEEIAIMFCEMDSKQQAVFFNTIATLVVGWEQDFCTQLRYVMKEPSLTTDGLNIMKQIGEAEWITI